jgi:hypothetical protein
MTFGARRVGLPGILVLAALAPGCGHSAHAPAASRVPPLEELSPKSIELGAPVTVPLLTSNNRPVVDTLIDGKGPYRFAVETGAHFVGITPRVSSEIGLVRVGGDDSDSLVHIAAIAIGDARFKDLTAVALKFSDPTIDGILGLNVFDGVLLTLDPAREVVRIERGTLPAPDHDQVLALKTIGELVGVDVTIGGKPFVACVDTRGAGTLTMMPTLASTVRFVAPLSDAGQARGAGIPATLRQSGRLDGDLRLGRYTVQQPIVFVHATPAGFPQVPILGCELLRQFTITLDLAHSRIRLARADRVIPPAADSK